MYLFTQMTVECLGKYWTGLMTKRINRKLGMQQNVRFFGLNFNEKFPTACE
jgi:hypothetical protein